MTISINSICSQGLVWRGICQFQCKGGQANGYLSLIDSITVTVYWKNSMSILYCIDLLLPKIFEVIYFQ